VVVSLGNATRQRLGDDTPKCTDRISTASQREERWKIASSIGVKSCASTSGGGSKDARARSIGEEPGGASGQRLRAASGAAFACCSAQYRGMKRCLALMVAERFGCGRGGRLPRQDKSEALSPVADAHRSRRKSRPDSHDILRSWKGDAADVITTTCRAPTGEKFVNATKIRGSNTWRKPDIRFVSMCPISLGNYAFSQQIKSRRSRQTIASPYGRYSRGTEYMLREGD